MTTTLKMVAECGETGDSYQRIDRDAAGNLYATNNAETEARLTGFEWCGWSEESIRDSIRGCVADFGRRVGLNVASQCGGYDQMTPRQQAVVDAWNLKYGR